MCFHNPYEFQILIGNYMEKKKRNNVVNSVIFFVLFTTRFVFFSISMCISILDLKFLGIVGICHINIHQKLEISETGKFEFLWLVIMVSCETWHQMIFSSSST